MTIDLASASQVLNFIPPQFQDLLPQVYELTDPSDPQRNIEIKVAGESDVSVTEYVNYSVLDNSLAQEI